MNRLSLSLASLLVCLTFAHAQQRQQQQHSHNTQTTAAAAATAPQHGVTVMPGLGALHHPVSTKSAEAQRFFDQGLTLLYAFNHDEAARSFARAAELDPQMAMAYWGIAVVNGSNYNQESEAAREKAAYDAVQKALALAKSAPENERAYIEALARRYSKDSQADLRRLAVDYKNAMGELMKRYPDDLDAATLYAESAMNLRPWKLWTADGKPAEGTEEIVTVLESVLRRNPDHIGAIHYYIHTIEASPTPERALAYVARLPAQVPAAGHLVHMPAHIYMRTGDYAGAARSNSEAAAADEAYIKASGAQGIYPVMYYNHNVHFLAIADSIAGRYGDSIKAARLLEANVTPYVKQMPMLEGFVVTPTLVLVRFRRWDDILRLPEPPMEMTINKLIRHFARGMAYAARGDIERAKAERKVFDEGIGTIPAEAPFGPQNRARAVLSIAGNVLGARLAAIARDNKTAIEMLDRAIATEDTLAYDEPPAWFMPVRETLGGLLLRSGDYAGAERVFRADLARNLRSGRSLFGLRESLKAQGKTFAAQMVDKEFESAWKEADTPLKIEDF